MKQSRETKKYAQAVFIVADETDQLTDTIQRLDILLNIFIHLHRSFACSFRVDGFPQQKR